MPIITSAEVKSLLQISGTAYDTLIATLIPLTQKKIMRYCKNYFLNYNIQLEGNGISFVSGTPATILDSNSLFVESFFVAGDYKIFGSKLNDKVVQVQTVAAGTLTLSTGETLVDEAAENYVLLTKVEFPDDLKLATSQAINYYLAKQGKLVSSESLPGGYSVTYKSEDDMFRSLFKDFRKL